MSACSIYVQLIPHIKKRDAGIAESYVCVAPNWNILYPRVLYRFVFIAKKSNVVGCCNVMPLEKLKYRLREYSRKNWTQRAV